jgi:hypothetical protein
MLNLENASILSYSQNSKFFGDAFNYQNEKVLTIEGVLRDPGNTDGVKGIQSAVKDLFSTDTDYSSIIINGYNFGYGKITNLNLKEGNDVRVKPYTISVVCYQTGNLYNLSGAYYTGIDQSSENRYDLINSLSEDFSYNKNGESYGYSHSVSIKLNSGNGVDNPILIAKTFANNLISSNTPFGFLTSGENQLLGFKTYNESYNVITNECSFSENYTRPKNNSGYLYTLVNSYSLGEDGIAKVSENANIKNITGNLSPSGFNALVNLTNLISSGSFSRCSALLSSYSGTGSGSYPLYTGYESFSKSFNHFSNTADYSISYTNDPKQVSGCSWSYTNEVSKEGRYYNVAENGTIIGHGVGSTVGYGRAISFYETVKSSAFSRNYSLYTAYVVNAFSINRIAESKNMSQFNGAVNYSFRFSDSPVYTNGSSGVKVEEISVNDLIPTQLLNKFEIFNFNEIVQPRENSTLGNRSLSLNLLLTKDHSFSTIKNYAKIKTNLYAPSGTDVFINSLNYTYNPNERKFSLNAGWTFQRDAVITI